MNIVQKHAKTLAAIVVGVIGWASSVVTSNPSQVTAGEWVQLAFVIATAVGVYSVTNQTNQEK